MKKFWLLIPVLVIICCLVAVSCGDNGENTNKNTSSDVQEYTIQYTDNTGNHTITVKNGDVYSLESIPQKTGYTFKGLFDLEEGGTQYVSSTGNSLSAFTDNKNMTLFPQFEAKEYTLVLDYQGAEVTGTRQIAVSYNSLIGELPINLTIPNKNFTGWYTDKDKGGVQVADKYGILPATSKITEKNFDLSDPDGFIYLYAGFEYQKYTLTLYIGESSVPEEVSVEWGTHISSVQTETRVDGKAVLTWSKSKNDTALANVFNGKVEGDMILYSAEYAPVIDFNSMGGKEVNSIVNRAGNTISLPTPKRENYTFMGWYDTNGSKFEATAMPESSLTLNAKWQANIMLNENGGTDVQDITAPVGEEIELPTPERAGYIFAGWYDASGNKYESKAMPENSIVLTAKYYAVKTEIITLINSSETVNPHAETPYFPSAAEFSGYSYCKVIDLSKMISSGTETIKIKVHYDAKPSSAMSFSSDEKYTLDMSYYSQPTASDGYLLWEYQDVFSKANDKYTTYTKQTTLNATSDKIYISIWSEEYSSFSNWQGTFYYGPNVTDFWVEIEYPDTSVLY